MTGRSIALFCAAALAEIGGAYLIWTGLREGKGPVTVTAGAVALVIYGLLAAQQPSSEFGRVLAAYGGIFVDLPTPKDRRARPSEAVSRR